MPPVNVEIVSSRRPGSVAPVVSVAMITYNHEPFITQAVESVMMQRTNFPYELVISDDCSPDATREIVLQLQRKYPDRIKLLLPDSNLGGKQNWLQNLKGCDGKYIATLEGDDFWLDDQKLQKQVDFLEANKECPACFTRAKVISETGSAREFLIPGGKRMKPRYDTDDLLSQNPIATCSLMFRNVISDLDFEPIMPLKMGDWPLAILLSQGGPIACLEDITATYRMHSGGLWSGSNEIAKLEAIIQMHQVMMKIVARRFAPQILRQIVKNYQAIALEFLRNGDKRSSRSYALKSVASVPLADMFAFAGYLKRSLILLLGSFSMSHERVKKLMQA